MGRARKPTHLKVIAGTERPDRKNPPTTPAPALDGIPDPPDWLPNSHALLYWKRLAPICIHIGTLTEGSLGLFAHMCVIHGKLVQLSAAGSTPSASLIVQLRALHADFGLNSRIVSAPTAAAADDKRPANPFDQFDD